MKLSRIAVACGVFAGLLVWAPSARAATPQSLVCTASGNISYDIYVHQAGSMNGTGTCTDTSGATWSVSFGLSNGDYGDQVCQLQAPILLVSQPYGQMSFMAPGGVVVSQKQVWAVLPVAVPGTLAPTLQTLDPQGLVTPLLPLVADGVGGAPAFVSGMYRNVTTGYPATPGDPLGSVVAVATGTRTGGCGGYASMPATFAFTVLV